MLANGEVRETHAAGIIVY